MERAAALKTALKPLLLLDLDGVLRTTPEALALVRTARQTCFTASLKPLGPDQTDVVVVSSAHLGFPQVLGELGYATAVVCADTEESAQAATAAGLDGVHVPDTAALRTALAVRGLIPPTVLLILPDRDEAEELAAELREDGWQPCGVHRDMLAGEDDAEDVDWIIELTTAPDGLPASAHHAELDALADRHDGFTGEY